MHGVLQSQRCLRLARHGLGSAKLEDHVGSLPSGRRLLEGPPQVPDRVRGRRAAERDGSRDTEGVDRPPAASPGSREQVLGHTLRRRLLSAKQTCCVQVVGGPLALRLSALDPLADNWLGEGQGFVRSEDPDLHEPIQRGDRWAAGRGSQVRSHAGSRSPARERRSR